MCAIRFSGFIVVVVVVLRVYVYSAGVRASSGENCLIGIAVSSGFFFALLSRQSVDGVWRTLGGICGLVFDRLYKSC